MDSADRDFLIELREQLNDVFGNRDSADQYCRIVVSFIRILKVDNPQISSYRQAYQAFVGNPGIVIRFHTFIQSLNLFPVLVQPPSTE